MEPTEPKDIVTCGRALHVAAAPAAGSLAASEPLVEGKWLFWRLKLAYQDLLKFHF
jgi:hypothetical protein